jgi:hypothetical protein
MNNVVMDSPSLSASSMPPAPSCTQLRHKSRRALVIGLIGLGVSVGLFWNIEALWFPILPLEGASFMLLATALGACLAVFPLVAMTGLWLSLWWAVNSVQAPRPDGPAPGMVDLAIYALGLLVWFAPVLLLLALAINALMTGHVHFSRPARDYFLATDPIPYWQSIGFWFISAGILGFLAWRYWQPRLVAFFGTKTHDI